MITVSEIDRLVVSDDATAAKLWPRLGHRVRQAYLGDRDGWVALRRKADAGETPSQSDLAAKQRAFKGWARAFQAAGGNHARRPPTPGTGRAATPAATAAAATPSATPEPVPVPPVPPPDTAPVSIPRPPLVAKAASGAGAAVAGGLALAGLIALGARRKRP